MKIQGQCNLIDEGTVIKKRILSDLEATKLQGLISQKTVSGSPPTKSQRKGHGAQVGSKNSDTEDEDEDFPQPDLASRGLDSSGESNESEESEEEGEEGEEHVHGGQDLVYLEEMQAQSTSEMRILSIGQ